MKLNVLFFRKTLVALTGLFLSIFLIVHLSANALLLFPEHLARPWYNGYSTWLRENPLIMVIAYLLYLSIIIHVIYALLVIIRNRKAKPVLYEQNRKHENSNWASQNMGLIGISILIFIVVHLANFWARIKLGMGESVGYDDAGNKDIYSVTDSLFNNIYYVAFYVLLMIPLGFHLYHGVKSAFMTLGFYHRRGLALLANISLIYAWVIAVGFAIIPIFVFLRSFL
ncbi:MAG: succinate dehydrogenase cytochrome b subunit [Flammeovirgaceae bacterium]